MATTEEYLDKKGLQKLMANIKETYAPIQALQYKETVATISALPTVASVKAGWMYNVTTGGTTTADFKEGAGQTLFDGANVAAINVGTDEDPVMKWDILPGVLDISDRLQFGLAMPASPEEGQTFLYMGNTTYTYDAVTPDGDEDPSEEGWYEYNGTGYELSEDTTVQTGTSYFEENEQYVKGVIYVYSGSAWVPQSSGTTYVPISDAFIDSLFD